MHPRNIIARYIRPMALLFTLACNPTPSYPELGCTPECCTRSPSMHCTSFWYSNRFAELHRPIREKILRTLPLKKGAVVVDVGAGSGSAEPTLSQRVGAKGRVIATELNPAVIKKLAAYIAKQKLANVVLRAVKDPHDTGIKNERPDSIDAIIFGCAHASL